MKKSIYIQIPIHVIGITDPQSGSS